MGMTDGLGTVHLSDGTGGAWKAPYTPYNPLAAAHAKGNLLIQAAKEKEAKKAKENQALFNQLKFKTSILDADNELLLDYSNGVMDMATNDVMKNPNGTVSQKGLTEIAKAKQASDAYVMSANETQKRINSAQAIISQPNADSKFYIPETQHNLSILKNPALHAEAFPDSEEAKAYNQVEDEIRKNFPNASDTEVKIKARTVFRTTPIAQKLSTPIPVYQYESELIKLQSVAAKMAEQTGRRIVQDDAANIVNSYLDNTPSAKVHWQNQFEALSAADKKKYGDYKGLAIADYKPKLEQVDIKPESGGSGINISVGNVAAINPQTATFVPEGVTFNRGVNGEVNSKAVMVSNEPINAPSDIKVNGDLTTLDSRGIIGTSTKAMSITPTSAGMGYKISPSATKVFTKLGIPTSNNATLTEYDLEAFKNKGYSKERLIKEGLIEPVSFLNGISNNKSVSVLYTPSVAAQLFRDGIKDKEGKRGQPIIAWTALSEKDQDETARKIMIDPIGKDYIPKNILARVQGKSTTKAAESKGTGGGKNKASTYGL